MPGWQVTNILNCTEDMYQLFVSASCYKDIISILDTPNVNLFIAKGSEINLLLNPTNR